MTIEEIEELKENNYVRLAKAETYHWADFSKKKLEATYVAKFGEAFNIVIYSFSDNDIEYYAIPYSIIKEVFADEYLAKDQSKKSGRWILSIKNHLLKVSNNPNTLDIKDFYSNKFLFEQIEQDASNATRLRIVKWK